MSNAHKRGYHHRTVITASAIAESDRLRLVVLSRSLDRSMVAFAAGISCGHLNKWMARSAHLSPEVQAVLTRWLEKNP